MTTETGEVLRAFAGGVDETPTWRFLGASGSVLENSFHANVVSRGAVPAVTPEDFGDLAEKVTVDTEPGEGDSGIHIVHLEGDQYDLEDFLAYLQKLMLVVEGEDPIQGLNGPLLVLAAVIHSALQDSGPT